MSFPLCLNKTKVVFFFSEQALQPGGHGRHCLLPSAPWLFVVFLIGYLEWLLVLLLE